MSNQELQQALAFNGGEKTIKTPFPARHHFGEEEKAACNRVMDEAIAKGEYGTLEITPQGIFTALCRL